MEPADPSKLQALEDLLRSLKRVAVALSGGVDSGFLLAVARRVLGDDVLALSVNTPYVSRHETDKAREFCLSMHVNHLLLQSEIPDILLSNPRNRCYLCKHHLFSLMKSTALSAGFDFLLDGTHADDSHLHRPGRVALAELGIISPLQQCGFTKNDIREYASTWGLSQATTPSNACLLTRIPYDQEFDQADLNRIEQAETYMRNSGFAGTRVRTHGLLARLEADPKQLDLLLEPAKRQQTIQHLKQLGYRFVTIDLEGYRSGCYDEPLDTPPA